MGITQLPTRVAVTGASGLIGTAVVGCLERAGVAVRRLVRRAPRPGADEARWDPSAARLDPAALEGVDAVVHLAGESIAQRWTPAVKHELRESRVRATALLARGIAERAGQVRTFVCGSAVGFYGDRGDDLLDESSRPGSDFLGRLALEWEASADAARAAGVRVVHPRTGIVLSPRGGVLQRLLPPFRMGVGGPIGSGAQWTSWIALADMADALVFALRESSLAGPANFVAPAPVTNRELSTTLGRVLHRPALLPVPPFALKLLFGGEMVEATLLASQRAVPRALEAAGFRFRLPSLEGALRHELRDEGQGTRDQQTASRA